MKTTPETLKRLDDICSSCDPTFRMHTPSVIWHALDDLLDDIASLTAERDEARAECRRLKDANAKFDAGIKAVADLIDNSHGVAGLHRNGDVALWDELLAGGRYEDWLHAFSEAAGLIEGDR